LYTCIHISKKFLSCAEQYVGSSEYGKHLTSILRDTLFTFGERDRRIKVIAPFFNSRGLTFKEGKVIRYLNKYFSKIEKKNFILRAAVAIIRVGRPITGRSAVQFPLSPLKIDWWTDRCHD